ncbi:DUF4253 domain-containing protein [Chitinophaga tropicalis]|uniref:DUF4253 domain-containing protein n=1 Tax=Chitinophaga tropicalis TaxID=2683588 RepID=A0A7K1U5T8_9BACT|nr:DUF4253 domain-containing protein [Chitinophaga tropicalis]MVT09732.1 DUF4253 domain-containing protein [Chitinophaga tropicalis]
MNKILLSLSLATVIYGCGAAERARNPFLERDYVMADSMHYDHLVIDELRKIVPGTISGIKKSTNNETKTGGITEAMQFEYEATPDNNNDYDKVKATLKKKGYLLFKSEENFGNGPDKFAVIKTKDQFDILRFKATNGRNYDITTDSILTKLKAWYTRFQFEITGADDDWVEIKLGNISAPDATEFAKEVYEFCPGIAEQDEETVDNLAIDILQTKIMFLWWQ